MFIDEAVIVIRSGKGGDGCVSFRREKYVPRGGPDGGDGGDGGDVVLRASAQLGTLLDVSRNVVLQAPHGRPGQGANRTGASGEDLVIEVPVGTVVRVVVPGKEPRAGRLLADLSADGQAIVAARGGRGGKGNKAFATALNQVPRVATEGEPAIERRLYLELKLLADVGLIGLPNAGKSTLLARLSAARPKIGAYPFTTLHPHLGMVDLDDNRRLVLADIPGLIEGAHEGHGLGIEFLRHVERTRVLAHLVSAEEGELDALAASYRLVERELADFNPTLVAKPRCVVLTKCDLLPPAASASLAAGLAQRLEQPVTAISAVSGYGLADFLRRLVSVTTDTPAPRELPGDRDQVRAAADREQQDHHRHP